MNGQIDGLLRGRKFKKIVKTSFESLREKYGIRQIDVEILMYFDKEPAAAASDVHRVLDLNKGQISTSLYDLCNKGFLISCPNQDDRRFVQYKMTEKGKEFLCESKEIREKLFRKLFDGVTPEEMDTLRNIVGKMGRNIETMNPVL